MILADTELCYDVTRCVTLFADYIRQDKIANIREVDKMGTDDGKQDALGNG